jgi:hypothetical protein
VTEDRSNAPVPVPAVVFSGQAARQRGCTTCPEKYGELLPYAATNEPNP